MSGTNTRIQTRTPRTPTKVRSRREKLSSLDEIPTKDITKSKSVGGTPATRRFIQCSAVRRSCPEFSAGSQREQHFKRHSDNRGYVDHSNSTESRRRSRSQSCLNEPNITNNSALSSALSIRSPNASNSLSKNIYKLWKNEQLCDVIINAGGTRFYVHRLVMAASCDHFARHANTGKQTICEYDVPNVSSQVMDEVLDFFYTSKLKITSANIEELLETSQNLGVKRLLDMCIDFLTKINLNNAVRNRAIAKNYGLNGVIFLIDKYVHEHFSTLVTTSAFLQSDFHYIYDIISSDILTKPDELQIFHACVKWIDFKRKERLKYTVALMSLIRFSLIPASEVVVQVEPVSFIFEIPECKDMLYSAFRHHALFKQSQVSENTNIISKHVSPTVQNLQGNMVQNSQSDNTNKEELDEQSTDNTETSDSLTSLEYQIQSAESEDGDRVVENIHVTNNAVDQLLRQRLVCKPSAGGTSHGNSKCKVYSDIITDATLQSPKTSSVNYSANPFHSKVARNISNVGKTQCVKEKKTDKIQSKATEILAQRLSSVTVNKRKISREDLATCSDYFEPVNKTSDDTGHKPVTELQSARHGSGPRTNAEISMEKTDISKLSSEAQKTVLPEYKRSKETDNTTKRRHSSPVLLQRPYKGHSNQTTVRSIGNFIQLSPIKSEPSFDLPPPPQPRVIMVVGGAGAYDHEPQSDHVNNSVNQFDPDLNTWRIRSQLPVPIHYCAVAVLKECIYVIGGRLSNTYDVVPIKDCYRYNVTNDRWDKVASLHTARSRHAAVTLNRAIYVIGGEDCMGMSCKTVEIYNPLDNSWNLISPMQEARVGPAAAAHRGRLFVGGGMMDVDKKFLLNTMEVYDPRLREWTFRFPLPVAVCGSSMVETAGVLFMVGGCVMRDGEPLSLDSILRFTDETDSWDGYKTLHVPRHDALVVALDSKLYIIGGESSAAMGHALSNVECIDVETDEHVPGIAPLLSPAYGISGCVFVSDMANNTNSGLIAN